MTESLGSGLPVTVQQEEDVARFITESSKFNLIGAKPAAFLPARDGKTSVARHGSGPKAVLQKLAAEYQLTGTLYGAAVIAVEEVRRIGLDLLADEPPPRHANVLGWAESDNPDILRAKRKEQALLLVQSSNWVSLTEAD